MLIFKAIRKIFHTFRNPIYTPINKLTLFLNGVKIESSFVSKGLIKVFVTRKGKVTIGKNFKVNSGPNHNIIGRQQKLTLWVDGELTIGDNVGISSTAIICQEKITIGNNVTIGGNTVIYDTDFHSLDHNIRGTVNDRKNTNRKPVQLDDNVFIGAHTTILKGVTIGKNSIVGACSVVTKNIPENEIWAGNPARFIKSLNKF